MHSPEDERSGPSRQMPTPAPKPPSGALSESGDDTEDRQRLAALYRYGILDTPEEEAFDRITNLAARLLDAPIALTTFVDEDRQWFKSCIGMEQRETPREVFFCDYNIRDNGVMVVEDATNDVRFADSPLVTGPPHIRFYAGAPLFTDDGFALGSLCVIDTEPRTLSDDDRQTLHTLAQVVIDELKLHASHVHRHAIFESIDGAFVSVAPDWRLTYVNQQTEALLKQPADDLHGQTLWTVFPDTQDRLLYKRCHAAVEEGRTAEFEAYVPSLEIWLRVKARPFEGGLSVHLDDITEQRQAQKQLRLLSQAVEDMKEAVLITDNQLAPPGPRIEYVNPAFTHMTGYAEAEVYGKTPRLLQGPKTDRATLDYIREHLEAGQPVETEAINYRKDGTPFEMQWTISPVRGDDGTIQHWVSVQRDVTEQRERDLRQTRELLDSIIETANVGICVTDKNGQFVRVNPAYTDLYGWSEEELIGEHFTKVVPPNSHADAADLHDRFIYDRNDETTGEWRVHGKDGAIRNVIITAGYLEQSGEPFKVTTVLDVTDAHKRKEALHAERDLLRSIFNTSAAAITVLNEHGTIIRANKRAQEVLGLVPSDVKGRTYNDPAWHITTVDGKPFPDDELPFAQVMNTEAPVYDIRHAIQWPNGDRRILSVNGAPLRDAEGTITGGVFVVENITEQVQIQHKLIEAKEEAESASRLKSAMIANMSHEVRTPITSMMGFAEILAEELEGRQAKHASTILRSSKRLYKTLASVLQLSKLRGGSYTPSWEEVDLRKVAAEVIETMQPKATNHGLTLEFAHPVHPVDTRTDPMAAQRIVTNLLDNAIKFTPAGGTVTVCVDQEQETPHEGAPYISVADTGIGIASEAIDEMFVAFKQESEGFARSHEGSGIGLAIVKQLVDEIGATITVESEKKAGTHMHVRFPQQSGETNAEDAGR